MERQPRDMDTNMDQFPPALPKAESVADLSELVHLFLYDDLTTVDQMRNSITVTNDPQPGPYIPDPSLTITELSPSTEESLGKNNLVKDTVTNLASLSTHDHEYETLAQEIVPQIESHQPRDFTFTQANPPSEDISWGAESPPTWPSVSDTNSVNDRRWGLNRITTRFIKTISDFITIKTINDLESSYIKNDVLQNLDQDILTTILLRLTKSITKFDSYPRLKSIFQHMLQKWKKPDPKLAPLFLQLSNKDIRFYLVELDDNSDEVRFVLNKLSDKTLRIEIKHSSFSTDHHLVRNHSLWTETDFRITITKNVENIHNFFAISNRAILTLLTRLDAKAPLKRMMLKRKFSDLQLKRYGKKSAFKKFEPY